MPRLAFGRAKTPDTLPALARHPTQQGRDTGARMNFPDWAPSEVVEYWRSERAEHDNFLAHFAESERAQGRDVPSEILSEPDPQLDLLVRLITHEEMHSAWNAVCKNKIDPMLVVHACQLASFGPTGIQQHPPKERRELVSEIRETARKLADLVMLTEYENILIDDWQKKRTGVAIRTAWAAGLRGEAPPPDVSMVFCPSTLSDVLHKVARFDPSKKWGVDTKRPGDPKAPLHLLVRRLDKLFQEKTGKRLRATVASISNAVFDAGITERQVSRIAP